MNGAPTTRKETIFALRYGLSLLPHGEARDTATKALNALVEDLDQAEELLDQGYDALAAALPSGLLPALDRAVFSKRLR